mgnify:CR=1 FL=1
MFENLNKKQKTTILIIAIIVAIGMIYFIYNKNQIRSDIDLESEILISNTSENKTNVEIQEDLVIIHIIGSVKNPGIVKLKYGSRIEDAIEAAGGLTENADITNVNLAYVLDDGVKIRIPSITDEKNGDEQILEEESGENIIEETNMTLGASTKEVNINKATETELQSLPGIGASLASRIIEYRNQNGKFSKIEDIKNVNGIGDSKYDNIKDFITVK